MSVTPEEFEDVTVFLNQCVQTHSLFRHFDALYYHSTEKQQQRMQRTAAILFGDLNDVLHRHLIIDVCRLTDDPKSGKADNLTIRFLIESCGLQSDAVVQELLESIKTFRAKLLPARNKIIAHADVATIRTGMSLGAATREDWLQFWSDIETLMNKLCLFAKLTEMRFGEIGSISDADGLHRALKHADCLDQLLKNADSALAQQIADLALSDD